MRKIKHILSILFLILLCSCHREVYYVQLANQEMFAFANDVKHDYDLKLVSYGGGFLDKINNISIKFSTNQKLNLDESRFFFTHLTQKFLDRINSNEEIRPYLANYPFTPKNLNFAIFFPPYCPEYSFEEPKYVTTVSMTDIYNFDNKATEVMYTVMYQNSESSRIILVETYEDALQKVSQQQGL